MQDHHKLVEGVSDVLKYYVDVKRKEEGFDNRTRYFDPYHLKINPKHVKKVGKIPKDTEIGSKKHSKSDSEAHLVETNEDTSLREQFYKDELSYHLNWGPLKLPDQKDDYKIHSAVPKSPDTNSVKAVKRDKKDLIEYTGKVLGARSELNISDKEFELLKKTSQKHKKTKTKVKPICYKKGVMRKWAEPESEPENEQVDDVKSTEPKSKEQNTETDIFDEAQEVSASNNILTYQIVVKTGERLGSQTGAKIKIQMLGSKGKSKWFDLKNSQTHHKPFKLGRVDAFIVESPDLGPVKAIKIGHHDQIIANSWFMDYVRVEDKSRNLSYNFQSDKWFGVLAHDHKTMRILHQVDQTPLLLKEEIKLSPPPSPFQLPVETPAKEPTPTPPQPSPPVARKPARRRTPSPSSSSSSFSSSSSSSSLSSLSPLDSNPSSSSSSDEDKFFDEFSAFQMHVQLLQFNYIF